MSLFGPIPIALPNPVPRGCYVPINCLACGRFVGYGGKRTGGEYDARGEWIEFECFCSRCSKPPTSAP